ncbi:hypothetical protein BGZ74_008124, partial [Mortierella antarctica]
MTRDTDATRMDKASSESAPENDNDLDQDMDMEMEMDTTQQQQQPQSEDNPSLIRRKRLTQACDPCRKKKIKCDGLKPSCGNCGKIDVQCTYLPSMKKRGPRQGYIELLEKRLDKMEKMLQHGPSAAILDPELLDSTSILDSPLRPAMASDREKKSDTSPTTPEARFFGSSSMFSDYLTSGEINVDPVLDNTLDSNNVSRPKRPLYGIREEIPRKDILDHLLNLFFDSVYYQFPILHPATFMQQYKEGKVPPNLLNAICASVARFSNHPDVLTTPAYLAGEPFATNVRGELFDSIDIPTVSNVQALIFLCMYEYGVARGPRAWMFGGMAIRQAQELGLNREDSSPIFYLRGDWVVRETRRRTFWACFMIDVLSSSSSGRPRMIDERDCEVLLPSEDNAWCEARPVVTEMLNNEHESPSDETNKQSDDASESSQPRDDAKQTGNDRNMDTAPDNSSTSGEQVHAEPRKPPSLSSLAYLIRVLAILGRVSQYVNRPRSKKAIPANEVGSEFSAIDAALGAWIGSAPQHLIYSRENKVLQDKNEGSIIVFMHIVYHTAVVLLHRPILAADKASFPIASHFIENSTARCAEAANRVSEILEFVSTQSCPAQVFISSFFSYPVFTTATIHITNAFSADAVVAARARRSLSIHVKILQTMKSYWSMADKFFYIIRDLYSIQSKISSSTSAGVVVPQVVSHNAHGDDELYDSPPGSAKEGCERRIEGRVLSALASGSNRSKETAAVPGMMVNNKSASISSFLKSDSGLIALWRRATEMQVIDGANQEKRKMTTANVDKELQEQRLRLDQLEIEEINAEFERQRKARHDVGMTQNLPSEGSLARPTHNAHVMDFEKPSQPHPQQSQLSPQPPQPHSQQDEPLALEDPQTTNPSNETRSISKSDSTSAEKRQKDIEVVNPRAAKQSKVTKAPAPRTTTSRKPRSNSGASISGPISGPWNPLGDAPSEPIPAPGSVSFQQIKPIVQPQAVFDVSSMPTTVNADSGVARHLLDVYNQQHRQQETISQTIDMAQNAVIQKQQMELQQQQQHAQMTSSLAFGPPGGLSSCTPSQSNLYSQPIQMDQQRSFPQQQQQHQQQPQPQQHQQVQQVQQQRQQPSQQHQQQPFPHQHQQSVSSMSSVSSSGYVFGASPVYNHFSDQSSVAPGPQESIFDFAFPMSDISFLSSSFQVPSNMMQERGLQGATNNSGVGGNRTMPSSTMNRVHVTNSGAPVHVNQTRNPPQVSFHPAPAQQQQQQQQQNHHQQQHHQPQLQPQLQPHPQQQQHQQHQMQHHGQSPTGSNKSQSISPSIASLMMSDDPFDAQSTPNSLMRYLQHHQQQQEQQQQLQQQQDMQPLLLNNQNSLIYDDYYQWNN